MTTTAVLAVALCMLAITSVWAADFLHLDCGAQNAYIDAWDVKWQPDAPYISTGAVGNVTNVNGWRELQYLRYFKEPRAKHCYTLPVTPSKIYMLRGEFFYGSYDNSPPPFPSFQLALDSSIVETVAIVRASRTVIREITFKATGNATSLCLIQDASKTTPFINSISLRGMDAMPQAIVNYLDLNQTVATNTRFYLRGDTPIIVSYPEDPYNRYWYGTDGTSNNAYPMSTATQILTTAPLESLSTTANVSISNPSYAVTKIPQSVLQGALTTTGNLTISLNTTTPFEAYILYYFVELDPLVNITDRSFYIKSVDADLYLNNVRNSTNSSLSLFIVAHNHASISSDSKIVMFPDPLRTSLKGPMLTAMEVFRVEIAWVPPTNGNDFTSVEFIKSNMNLGSWRGDPCLPYPHEWVACGPPDATREASVLGITLSGYNLTGAISPSFGSLKSITTLKLDNNTLTGTFPDLRTLTNLKFLHLQNNNLTGSIPEWLASMPNLEELYLQNNGFSGAIPAAFANKNWKIDYSGNPLLNAPATSTKKPLNIGVIIGEVVGGVVVLALIVGLIVYFACCRKGRRMNLDSHTSEMQTASSQRPDALSEVTPGGAREYSLAEIVAATSNYKREIGRGGFGPVYYGRFPDGKEVAVKALDKTSRQGQSEFFNEVDILSRVHHRNLVSLVGYCRDQEKQMLIYEFIHKGSLRDHLDGDFAKSGTEILDWKTRLSIALQAAQGLEYLHTGCSPSLIHRDVKSSNILITSRYDAKVADFGLSRLVGEEDATKVLTFVKGTAGYLDPEYYSTQYLSAKSDVYGYGVVLLELITGRLPIDRTIPNEANPNICDWVRSSLEQGNIDAILDTTVRNSRPNVESLWKVAEIALRSVEPKGIHRPKMNVVVQELHAAVALEAANSLTITGPPSRHARTPSSGYSDYSSNMQFGPVSQPTAR